MQQKTGSEYIDLDQIQQGLFNIANNGESQKFYIDIQKGLQSLASKGYLMQSKNLTIEIMKSYTRIPDLILELKKLLTDSEFIDFETWRKNTEIDNPELECPICNSHKVALNIANIPIYNEQSTKNLESNKPEPVNLYNYSNYICMLCDAGFYKYQQ